MGKKGKRKVLLDVWPVVLVVGRHLVITHSSRCVASYPRTAAVPVPWLAFAAAVLAEV